MRRLILLLLVAIGGLVAEYCKGGQDQPSGPETADRSRFADQLFRVDRVIDGDTAILSDGTTIRYIGIDAPEMVPTPTCGAREATDLNRELVEGKAVTIRLDDAETRDRFGRLLGYLERDDDLANVALVRSGWACAFPFGETRRFRPAISAAEEEARSAGRGIWGACPDIPRRCRR